MDTLTIRCLSFKRRSFYFWNKFCKERTSKKSIRGEAGKYATAPVIVLMAMNPSLLNSNAATLQEQEITPNIIETQAPEYENEANEATYVMASELDDVEQSYPFGWAHLRPQKIMLSKPAKGNGEPHHLIFAGLKYADGVYNVYLIKDGQKGSSISTDHPSDVRTIIYHDLGPGKEFCSVRTWETKTNKQTGVTAMTVRDVRIDDDTANEIINLRTGHSKFKCDAGISFEETKSPKLEPVSVTYY